MLPMELEKLQSELATAQQRIATLEAQIKELSKPHRTKPDSERLGITQRFVIASKDKRLKGYVTVNSQNERPIEMFIRMTPLGTLEYGLLEAVGRLTSLCLQYGVPPEALAKQFEYSTFEPSGFIKGHFYRSVLDYIFQWFHARFVPADGESNGAECTSYVSDRAAGAGNSG